MKKALILSSLIFMVKAAQAQEAGVEATSFYQDKTFLMLVGGAAVLVIILIIKKIMDKKSEQA